jgi:hypothetical protein
MDEPSEFDKRSIALAMAMSVQRHCYQPSGDRYTDFNHGILERAEKFYQFLSTSLATSGYAQVVDAPSSSGFGANYKRPRYDNPAAADDEIPF